MIVCLFTAIAGAIIEVIFDDGDSSASDSSDEEKSGKLSLRERAAWIEISNATPGVSEQDRRELARNIVRYNPGISNSRSEVRRITSALYGDRNASQAELQEIQSKYLPFSVNDNTSKKYSIYNPIDPSDDGDAELNDSFSFETETENIFGPEQMAISEEDIAPESDIQDWDITEPTDEISQDREIIVGDDTVDPEDEISSIEETTPFEQVFYPDESDLDMDPTDDFQEVLYPKEQYDISDTTDDFIQWPEQELDDMAGEVDDNIFDNAAWTFDQDMSQEALTNDKTYQDVSQAMNVIDFEDFLDDTAAITLDLISDHMGVAWFQWLDQPPGGEVLDTSPF